MGNPHDDIRTWRDDRAEMRQEDEAAVRSLMDKIFGSRADEIPAPKLRTPVELPEKMALRMRCVELVLERKVDEGGTVDFVEVVMEARRLERFVRG